MTSRALLLAIPFGAALALGCGGSIASVDPDGADGGASPADASLDRAAPGADGASAACPADLAAAAGTACSDEGRSCGGPCTDECSFCNGIRCTHGVWVAFEAPPAPCADAAARVYPTASLSWQGPGGVTGRGPAIVANGDGSVRVWSQVTAFDPASSPSSAPAASFTLSGAQIDDLFARWSKTNRSGLPHGDVPSECDAVVHVATCATCAAEEIRYHDAGQVAPEMTDVWSWFTATFPTVAEAHTGDYCHFE